MVLLIFARQKASSFCIPMLNTMVSQKFCNIFVHVSLQCVYHVTKAVQAIVGNIVVVGALTQCALLHCHLKAAHMNIQCSLVQELMLYETELGYNAAEPSKKICVEDEGTIDDHTVTRWFNKIY